MVTGTGIPRISTLCLVSSENLNDPSIVKETAASLLPAPLSEIHDSRGLLGLWCNT